MPFFAEETLEAVRSIPLYEIVRSQVDLSRSGKNWRGLSPFSNEKTPSFFVLTDRNYFKCHSSGMAGDGIKFIQETERLPFQEAVEALAERFNIPIQYATGSGPDPMIRSLKQEILDIHDYARDYYHQAFLAKTEAGAWIRDYWEKQRGFPLDLAREFQIGYSPTDDRGLLGLLTGKGFSIKALGQSGLFRPGHSEQDLDSWYFTFRGRLMIPIRNIQGQVVAFTARQLDLTPRDHGSWKAKYINSPETPVFKKGQLLFNLDRAREVVKEAGSMLLVEGQLDALRCWECGLGQAIAPQGTSITEDQLSLVKRYTDSLEVFMDSDEAGSRAVLRMLPMAFKNRLQVQVLSLPKGADPDDFLRHGGKAAMENLKKESGIQFAGRFLLGGDAPTPEEKANALQSLFGILAQCPSAVVREGYLDEAIQVTGVSRRAALIDFQKYSQAEDNRQRAIDTRKVLQRKTNTSETLTNLEGDLLWSVLKKLEWAESLEQVIDQKWIQSETQEGRILSLILGQSTVDQVESVNSIYALLDTDEERDCLNHFDQESRSVPDLADFIMQTISALIDRYYKNQIESINHQIVSNTDIQMSRELFVKKRELTREKSDLIRSLAQSIDLNG